MSYYNGKSYSMSWRNGRELEQVKVGGKTYRYEYDGNGQRTRKSNEDGGYTEYYLVDGLAVAERRYYAGGSERYTMRYLYDESNSPVGLGLKYPGESLWTYFYFEKNVQGDVIGLYRSDYSSSRGYYGTLVARYSYDPYGRPVSMTNASGTTISQTAYNVAAYNPFRYRGYRYDGETGLYYLQSRYYDPETCRFINADCSVSTGQGLNGHNMFSYSLNDPISAGYAASAAVVCGAGSMAAGVISSAVTKKIDAKAVGWNKAEMNGIINATVSILAVPFASSANLLTPEAPALGAAISFAVEIIFDHINCISDKSKFGFSKKLGDKMSFKKNLSIIIQLKIELTICEVFVAAILIYSILEKASDMITVSLLISVALLLMIIPIIKWLSKDIITIEEDRISESGGCDNKCVILKDILSVKKSRRFGTNTIEINGGYIWFYYNKRIINRIIYLENEIKNENIIKMIKEACNKL